MKDLRQANKVLKEMKEAAARGEAVMEHPAIKGEPMFVSHFDASLGKEQDDGASAFCDLDLSREGAFHSGRMIRVVRSTKQPP